MTALVAVLEESEKIRRRIGLLDLAPKRLRSRMFSNSTSPASPVMMEDNTEVTNKAGEWTLPGKEEI